MKEVSFLRHSGWFGPETAGDTVLNIIGVGATGSHIGLYAAKMGFHNFQVWDLDIVENHNLPNQIYENEDIGSKKVDAFGFGFGWVNDLLNNMQGKGDTTTTAPATTMSGGGGPPNRTFVNPSTSGSTISNAVSSRGMSPGAMGGSNISFSADTNTNISNSNTTNALISNGPAVDLQDQMLGGLT